MRSGKFQIYYGKIQSVDPSLRGCLKLSPSYGTRIPKPLQRFELEMGGLLVSGGRASNFAALSGGKSVPLLIL